MLAKHAVHAFELSGLGRAPFHVVTRLDCGDWESEEAARTLGVELGACQHCGRRLVRNYLIHDRDGRCSVVGRECVKRTGDRGLLEGAEIQDSGKLACELLAKRRAAEAARGKVRAEACARRRADHAARTAGLAERNAWLLDLPADERDRGMAEHLGRLLRNFDRRELNTAQREWLRGLYAARHGDPGTEAYRTSSLAFEARWALED